MNLKHGTAAAILAGLLVYVSALAAQTAEEVAARNAARASRVAALTASLRPETKADWQRYESIKQQATEDLFAEVERYLGDSFNARLATSVEIQAGLNTLLSAHKLEGYSEGAFATLVSLPTGSFLLSGLELVEGGVWSAFRLSAYSTVQGRLLQVAYTGSDLDNHDVVTEALRSPVPGEAWLICHGGTYGYNGTLVRVRIYAFDGTGFRTVFAPEDFKSTSFPDSFELTPNGFKFHYVVPNDGTLYTDEYTLTANGPLKVSQTGCDTPECPK